MAPWIRGIPLMFRGTWMSHQVRGIVFAILLAPSVFAIDRSHESAYSAATALEKAGDAAERVERLRSASIKACDANDVDASERVHAEAKRVALELSDLTPGRTELYRYASCRSAALLVAERAFECKGSSRASDNGLSASAFDASLGQCKRAIRMSSHVMAPHGESAGSLGYGPISGATVLTIVPAA